MLHLFVLENVVWMCFIPHRGGGSPGQLARPAPTDGACTATPHADVERKGVMLILGASDWQRAVIQRELERTDQGDLVPATVTAEVNGTQRLQLYSGTWVSFSPVGGLGGSAGRSAALSQRGPPFSSAEARCS